MGWSFIEVDNLRSFVVKKFWLSVANDSSVVEVFGFVCGSMSIRSARGAFHAIEAFSTMSYGIDLLKTYEDSNSHFCITKARHSRIRSENSTML